MRKAELKLSKWIENETERAKLTYNGESHIYISNLSNLILKPRALNVLWNTGLGIIYFHRKRWHAKFITFLLKDGKMTGLKGITILHVFHMPEMLAGELKW